jgi:plastocyanin
MLKIAIMLSSLLLLPVAAAADTFIINQVNTTYSPDELTIHVGDTVEWHWSSLAHTVTSGTGAADPEAGDLFDEPLDVTAPIVSYTFTTAGDVPFFCRPHEVMGMTGIIHVLESTPTEASGWGNIKALY